MPESDAPKCARALQAADKALARERARSGAPKVEGAGCMDDF
jgi:hypothetical protein